MWCDHPLSQRDKATKRAVEVNVGSGEGIEQNLKKGVGWWAI